MGTVELNLAEVMKEKNLSPEDMVSIPGIGEEGAKKIIEGPVSAVRLSTLAAICDGLGCEPGDVFRYTA